MNRTWTFFMGISIFVMLAMFVYELYISVSGGNVTFDKTVAPIESSLGSSNFLTFMDKYPNLTIKTEELDDK